jgi:hypothetical protein
MEIHVRTIPQRRVEEEGRKKGEEGGHANAGTKGTSKSEQRTAKNE